MGYCHEGTHRLLCGSNEGATVSDVGQFLVSCSAILFDEVRFDEVVRSYFHLGVFERSVIMVKSEPDNALF